MKTFLNGRSAFPSCGYRAALHLAAVAATIAMLCAGSTSASAAEKKCWYLCINGVEKGPFTDSEIQANGLGASARGWRNTCLNKFNDGGNAASACGTAPAPSSTPAPAASGGCWYLCINGVEKGPYTDAQISANGLGASARGWRNTCLNKYNDGGTAQSACGAVNTSSAADGCMYLCINGVEFGPFANADVQRIAQQSGAQGWRNVCTGQANDGGSTNHACAGGGTSSHAGTGCWYLCSNGKEYGPFEDVGSLDYIKFYNASGWRNVCKGLFYNASQSSACVAAKGCWYICVNGSEFGPYTDGEVSQIEKQNGGRGWRNACTGKFNDGGNATSACGAAANPNANAASSSVSGASATLRINQLAMSAGTLNFDIGGYGSGTYKLINTASLNLNGTTALINGQGYQLSLTSGIITGSMLIGGNISGTTLVLNYTGSTGTLAITQTGSGGTQTVGTVFTPTSTLTVSTLLRLTSDATTLKTGTAGSVTGSGRLEITLLQPAVSTSGTSQFTYPANSVFTISSGTTFTITANPNGGRRINLSNGATLDLPN